MKCAARITLEIQNPENSPSDTITQLCRAISSQPKRISTFRKKTC